MSEWTELSKAKDVDCEDWPKRETDLDTKDVKVIADTGSRRGVAILAQTQIRTGELIHTYLPFASAGKVGPKSLRDLRFGQGARLLGAYAQGGKTFAVVAQRRTKGAGVLEIRRLPDNVVEAQDAVLPSTVSDGFIVEYNGGFWLVYKGEDEGGKKVAAEGSYAVAQVSLNASAQGRTVAERGAGRLTFKRVDTPDIPLRPQVATLDNGSRGIVLWPADGGGGMSVLRIVEGKVDGGTRLLELGFSALEGWAVTSRNQEFALAYVEGDSMVGNAELAMARFSVGEVGAAVLSKQKVSLRNEHVSDPLWLSSKAVDYVLILKWVDAEATLAKYKASASLLEPGPLSGVFPNGSRVVDAYVEGTKSDPTMIVRSRSGNNWRFQVCKLEDL